MASKITANGAIQLPPAHRIGVALPSFAHYLKVPIIIIILVGGSALGYLWWSRRTTAVEYLTDKVSRGNVQVVVSATGTAQAVVTVQVGSQVSGTVAWLGADFKSRVKRGQIIAKLDPALFQAQVNTARANLSDVEAAVQAAKTEIANQTASVAAAKANEQVNRALRDDAASVVKQNQRLKGVIPDRDIEASENQSRAAAARYDQSGSQIQQAEAQLQSAQAKLKQSHAAVDQAKAQLDQAQVNLQHTIIASPIDGVVVSRNVDVGQTVAASLQAPTLFTIANNLENMQVLASIDEADVGQIREGGEANFTVDAYPGQTFNGTISQIRLNAQTQQNVVTYTAVVDFKNSEEKLMPGMTANITIPVARRTDVLRVPNTALRFKPDLTDAQQQDLTAKSKGHEKEQTIWFITANNTPDSRFIKTGITDGRVTEIVSGDLKEGDQILIGQTGGSQNSSNQQTTSPLSGQRPAGGRVR